MECGLTSYRKLRNICKCICFGSVFLWILLATSYKQYFPRDGGDSGGGNELHYGDEYVSPGTRKLLDINGYKLSSNDDNYTINEKAEVLPYLVCCKLICHSFYNCAILLYISQCSELHSLPKHDQALLCEFVTKVTACGGGGGFIPYFKMVYCWMPPNLLPLSMTLLVSYSHIDLSFILLGMLTMQLK